MFHLDNYRSFKPEDYILFSCIMAIFVVLLILLVENFIEYRHVHEARGAVKPEKHSEVDETDD